MHTPGPDPLPPYGPTPYGGPLAPPPVWTWFRVYVGLMALLYLGLAAMGLFVIAFGSTIAEASRNPSDAFAMPILGAVYAVLGFVFLGVFAYGLMMPRKPWAWIYGLVLICFGMTSLCCMPASIPLLIFWIKPEMKAFFGRS
jgi:cell division protein FtsW (lipid II flippase)